MSMVESLKEKWLVEITQSTAVREHNIFELHQHHIDMYKLQTALVFYQMLCLQNSTGGSKSTEMIDKYS